MEKIQAILLGLGAIGRDIIQSTYKRGVVYTGVFDVSPKLIGQDVGLVIQHAEMGVTVEPMDKLDDFLKNHQVDIAIITVPVPFEAHALTYTKKLLANQVNVLTSLADIYVMQHHFPQMYEELDALAKENSVTFFASGIQDVFWTVLPVALTGCNLEIREIRGVNVALIDHFGPAVADECYVGWSLDEFERANASGTLPTNDFLIALYELAKKLELHPCSERSFIKPLLAKEDTYFKTIDRYVEAGQLLGNRVESVLETEEGITLRCHLVSKMAEESDTDLNSWEIIGVPTINIITEHMQGEITTSSSIINRIPDVINAPPGVVSASEMAAPFFKSRGLNEYIR